jgi:flagellar hook-associated protein 2
MSISPTTSSFNFDGIVSGLKTSDVITQMMQLDRAPLTQLTNQQTRVQTRDSAYQALKGQVSAFQTSVKKLLLNSNINVKAVSSSTATVATATAGSGALNGTYQLNVTRVATASKISSGVWSATANAGAGGWVSAPIGAGLDDGSTSGTKLANAGFAIPVTGGKFTINGVAVTGIDPTTQTLDQVVQQINATVTSVQATVTTDANGVKNFISLHSLDGQPIQLGAGDDTSNFLSAAHLVSTGIPGDLVSSVPLGSVNTSATLANAHLGAALSGTGSFMVNGQTITWDASKDTISSVLNKINASSANVRAAYDPTSDSVTLTNTNTGSQSVALSNDTGGFLAAMHLMGGSVSGVSQQTLGTTAQFSINGGAAIYSNSNTVTGVLNGVSINLATTGSTTLSVSQDTSTTVTNVQAFATAFNSLVDAIDADTKYDSQNKKASVLTGDSGVQGLADQIHELLSNAASSATGAYKTLGDLGI